MRPYWVEPTLMLPGLLHVNVLCAACGNRGSLSLHALNFRTGYFSGMPIIL